MTIAHEQLQAALAEFDLLDQELARRRRDYGIRFYVPNKMQHRAHQSKANTILYVGGNRAGKTTWGAVEFTWALTRQYPDWFPQERRFTKPIKGVIVATEFPIVQRVIEPKMLRYLPKDYIKRLARSPQGYLSRLECVDGSTVDILTNEMTPLAFESADWDVAWIDEPIPRGRYISIRRGLVDRNGRCLFTFTPLVEPWMKEELVDAADGVHLEAFTVDIRDNLQDIEGTPILTEHHIQELERALTEDEKETRLHGKFFHLKGVIYGEYTPSIHEKVLAYQYPDPVVCILDPHTRKPHHVIWAWVRRDDSLYVDRELAFPGTLVDFKKRLLLEEARAGYKMAKRLCDPNFGRTPNVVTGRTVIQELAKPPFPVQFGEANDEKEAGILRVRDLLHWDRTKPIDPLNTPRLFFHPRCTKTIHSIQNYQFDEWRGALKDDRDQKEKEKQKDTDGADCVRYLAMARPRFDRLTHRDANRELEDAVAYA